MNEVAKVNEVLPPVNLKDVEDAITNIRGSWKKSVDAIFETAALIRSYQMSPDWLNIKNGLLERKIIDISVIDMLTAIAGNRTLTDERYRDALPPHYNNLNFLSRIKGDNLVALIENGAITSATTLADAKKLASEFGNLKKPQKARVSNVTASKYMLQLTIDPSIDENEFINIIVAFIQGYEGVSVKVV